MKQEIFESYAGAICERFNITSPSQLFVKTKRRDIVDARHLLYYMCRNRPMRLRYIQQYMLDGGYDISHSSIIHGIAQVDKLVKEDDDYKRLIEDLQSDVVQP
jgi:chromosomal replication initiation ATPase DnaA